MRPKFASGCSVATKPYTPSAITPPPIHNQPRSSRTPCQTSHAPPISIRAASANNATERRIMRHTVAVGGDQVDDDVERAARKVRDVGQSVSEHVARSGPITGRASSPDGAVTVVATPGGPPQEITVSAA